MSMRPDICDIECAYLKAQLNAFPVNFKSKEREKAFNALRNKELFDGDIVLNNETAFNAVPNDMDLWPNGVIPYEFDHFISDELKHKLLEAFRYLNRKTNCIEFIERINEQNYLFITPGEGKHCSSMVGMNGGRQELVLGDGCEYLGTVLHELMHAIGFYHEHSRSDRDDFIRVHYQNIKPQMEHNFIALKANENRLLEPFDYQSINIYGEYSFSRNQLPTMTAKERGETLTDPYSKNGLSYTDINAVQKLYKCL